MNSSDPILQQRRCDARLPELGAVCALEQGHEGDHEAQLDGYAVLQANARQQLLQAALRGQYAAHAALGAALRELRVLRVLVAALSLLDLVLLGLRIAGA